MKFVLNTVAAAAVLASAGAASAITPDSKSLTYQLNGSVESVCALSPEGTSVYNVDMEDFGNQGFAVITYSCNSPYTLKISSANGGMKHAQSSLKLVYDVETFGFTDSIFPAFGSFNSVAIQAAPAVVASQTDWENILTNGGIQTGNLDLQMPSLSNQSVAGDYSDELTITLTADL